MQFISDSQADIQQFTPDMKEKSHAIEMIAAGVIIASIILAPEVDVAVAAVEGAVELGEAAAAEGAAASEAAPELVTVTHFTSAEGVEAIGASGELRAGTFVTIPAEVSGMTASEVESALEIQPGRGAFSTIFQTPVSNLGPAFNGPVTSGNVLQWQLIESVPIAPGSFMQHLKNRSYETI